MLKQISWKVVVASLVLLVASGCKVDFDNKIVVETEGNLTCNVTLASPGTVISGVPVNLAVLVNGGIGPYSIPGIISSFTGTANYSTTFANASANSIVVNHQLGVQDSVGHVAVCSLQVTVQGTNPSNLACTLNASPSSTTVNSDVLFTASSTGGTGTRSFGTFTKGADGVDVVPFNSATGTAVVKYAATGTKTASLTVSDSSGNTASCSQNVIVLGISDMALTASPATTISTSSTFTVTAAVSNPSSLGYNFAFTHNGGSQIRLVQGTGAAANTATITSLDAIPRSFVVQAVATNAGQTLTASLGLSFQAVQLTCALTHTAGTYNAGDTVPFRVAATSSTEPVQFVSFFIPDGTGTVSVDTASVRFSTSGTKSVRAVARSLVTGQYCNNGAELTDSVQIGSTSSLACTFTTNRNPSFVGEVFLATVAPTGNTGTVRITSINSTVTINGGYNVNANGTSANAVIYSPGAYPLTATIQDQITLQTATCTVQHTVY